jgi:hypothetical protein
MTNDDRRRLREGIKRGSDMLAICTQMRDRGVMTEEEYTECLRIIGVKKQVSTEQLELFV